MNHLHFRFQLAFRAILLALLLAGLTLIFPLPGPMGAADEGKTAALQIQPGDHVCLIGNTLAERMQHDGWLETLLQSRFPQHQLVIRDLGFSGDELTLRLRSEGFGSTDDWLSKHKADVIFTFFGYNESFAGQAGLEKFKKNLDDFIQHTLGQKYNGKTAPRLVLFSPIAHENLHSRNFPDGSDNNKRIALYTKAMAEVARANHIPFVDLFKPSLGLYEKASHPLTINGIHLNEDGNHLIAQVIDQRLFAGVPEPKLDSETIEKLRQAVLDKNFYWFYRYRTVDGYNIYGGRSYEKYAQGQTNRAVMQREMEVLDVMAANRDKRIWAVAQGGDLKVDDSNTPPFIPTKTNKPGPGPGGSYIFLDGQEAIGKMTVAKGMKINLFASEKDFPELAKPVQMAFDTKGRLWVAVWPSYPHWKPKDEMNDKLIILEDTAGDGKADKMTVFADHLNCPTGFAFYNGGVIVAQAPDLIFLKDTDGDGKADVRIRVLGGIDSADSHHTANSFAVDPGGALYFQEGVFHRTQVETPYGPPRRLADAGVFRYEPRTHKFEIYVTYPFANPHGHVFDRWGRDIVYDGTGANPYDAALISGHLGFPHKHPTAPQVYQQRTRPCPGVEILSSRHFPEANQGNLLVANVIGFQGILQYQVHDKDSSLTATEVEPIVSSTDANFRPSDIKIGPDGAIYFLDWQNPLIGHLQHHIRDPNRDRTHGRIYRVTYEGRPLLKPAKVAGEPIDKLLDRLKEPEDGVRSRAKIELGGRDGDQVIEGVKNWVARLDKNDPNYQHHLLEALWVHQYHNIVNVELLKRMLGSPDAHARAAAVRVLCYWRDRVPDALELLKKQAADTNPRVRLEAVRAASFFAVPEAVEIALNSLDFPSDKYLDYTRHETMKALEPYWKKAIMAGQPIAVRSETAARYLLHGVNTDELLRLKRNRAVFLELLFRPGVRDEYRREAAVSLGRMESKDELHFLLDAIRKQDQAATGRQEAKGTDDSVLFDLVRLLTTRSPTELAGVRPALEDLATRAKLPVTRQLGFVALIAADAGIEKAWALGTKSLTDLLDLVNAMPLVRDPSVRADLYPKVEPLLLGLPRSLSDEPGSREAEHVIRRAAMNALTYVRGQETETFKKLARFVREDVDREAAIRALLRIPTSYWPGEEAKPLIESITTSVRNTPARERTSPAAQDALQLGYALASLLPAEEAKRTRRELAELGVRVIRLGTVPDQMLYDKERLVVQAGKPVELIFENNDLMPHNFVITQPGALEEIGVQAEATATQPGALERHYVPASNKVILSSQLLQPRNSQKLSFTAPVKPGVYPYVCTYPGHWRRMYGALYVIEDMEQYLTDAEGYLAKHPLPAADELLKFMRPRKEWKFEDLTAAVEQLDHGRSFANGKQMFTVANCVACHKMNGAGNEFGPDLTKLDPKQQKPIEILRDILEPSFRINEKYYTYVFETQSGKRITGLILEETPETVKIIEDPLAKTKPVILKTSDIASREKSPTSQMPKGLLDKLTREEILDLIAYIASRGDQRHALFQGEHAHGEGH
jgi:putative heme-binding domain-containing protein